MPIHVVLTEIILCNGGNLKLVKIMNKLGAVACNETRCRLSTKIVQQRFLEGVKKSLVLRMLTVVSMDNIDILQPHAVVSTLDATRSWHGTSVQYMQPLPVTGALTSADMVPWQHQPRHVP